MMAAKLCAIHLLPDVLMDRNSKQQGKNSSNSSKEVSFSMAHKLLLSSMVFAAFLRMVEYSLFPSLYQRPFQTEKEQSYYLENNAEFCEGFFQIKSNIGRSGGLELLMYFIHELCWLVIFFPIPYMFVPEKWETPSWCSKLQLSVSTCSLSPDSACIKINSLWKDMFHWLLRPAFVQPLRMSSTTQEEMALLVMLGMMNEECVFNDQQVSLAVVNNEGGNKKKKTKKNDSVYMPDAAKCISAIMNSGTSSKASLVLHSIMNQHQWVFPDPWSELRLASISLIFLMALVRLYSFLCLINFEILGYFIGSGIIGDSPGIVSLDRLVVHGFYGLTRNPMCIASFGSAFGLLCASPSPMGMLALPILYVVVTFQISNEEKELLCYYGDAYAEYAKKVPRFLGLTDSIECALLVTSSMTQENCKIFALLISVTLLALVWFVFFLDYGGLRPILSLLQGSEQKRLQNGADALFEGRLRAVELLHDNQYDTVRNYFDDFDSTTVLFEKTLQVEDRLLAMEKEWKMADLIKIQNSLLQQKKISETDVNSSLISKLTSVESERVFRIQRIILSRVSSIRSFVTKIGLLESFSEITSYERNKQSIIKPFYNSLGDLRDEGIWKKCILNFDVQSAAFELNLDVSSRFLQSGDPLPFLFSAKNVDDVIYVSPFFNFPKSFGDGTPNSYYCAVMIKDTTINGRFNMYRASRTATTVDIGDLLLTVSIKSACESEGKEDHICPTSDGQVQVTLAPSREHLREEIQLSSLRVTGFVDDRVNAFSPQNMFLVRNSMKKKTLGETFDVWLQLGKRIQGDAKRCYALDFDSQMTPLEAFGVALCLFAV